jgi:hypothetical protein
LELLELEECTQKENQRGRPSDAEIECLLRSLTRLRSLKLIEFYEIDSWLPKIFTAPSLKSLCVRGIRYLNDEYPSSVPTVSVVRDLLTSVPAVAAELDVDKSEWMLSRNHRAFRSMKRLKFTAH